MGQKVHPEGFRLGIIFNWKSRWFNKKEYKDFLAEDIVIRDFLLKKLSRSGIQATEIERSANAVNIIIKSARPGLLIGRGGAGLEELKKELTSVLWTKIWKKKNVIHPDKPPRLIKIQIEEIKFPDTYAQIVAQNIASDIEKRIRFRRIMKKAIERVMQNKEVQGVKVMISGRLDGAEMSRSEHLSTGKIPLHTIRANIDFACVEARTTYGVVGVKVWIYKGEVFDKKIESRK
jgi:small subunit ribosomal protein S3